MMKRKSSDDTSPANSGYINRNTKYIVISWLLHAKDDPFCVDTENMELIQGRLVTEVAAQFP